MSTQNVDAVAVAIGTHEGWQRPSRFWECACGDTFGTKSSFDKHVAQAAIEAMS